MVAAVFASSDTTTDQTGCARPAAVEPIMATSPAQAIKEQSSPQTQRFAPP